MQTEPPDRVTIERDYRTEVAAIESNVKAIEQKSAAFSRFRGITFFSAVGFLIGGRFSSDFATVLDVIAGLDFAAFVVLATLHETLLETLAPLRHRIGSIRLQLARMQRDWPAIPVSEVELSADEAIVAADLNLFGRASLFDLVSQAHTPMGMAMLKEWLLRPAPPNEIRRRHEAVQSLATEDELRATLDVTGRMLRASATGPAAFVAWAEGPSWLTQRPWLLGLVRILSVALLGTLLLGCAGVIPKAALMVVSVLLITASVLINAIYSGRILEIFDQVSSRANDIQHYQTGLELFGRLPRDAPLLDELCQQLGASASDPLRDLRSLRRIMGMANLRRQGLIGLLYVGAALLIFADFHLLAMLEKWQRRHGSSVRGWFESIGTLEALSSLATLAHDHPQWSTPDVSTAHDRIESKQLGHPLLGTTACVRNDVTLGPPGCFLLVTGSNMSGKSTLLRAIGANVALAQAGGPVCASLLRLPPLEIATSMRVQDSLADGLSFFMAELKRMKAIVDRSRAMQQAGSERRMLYLLDEILQGTNSAERQIAVARIIGFLVESGAIGAVSTHDLQLADAPELASHCQTVHFRETIEERDGGKEMTFDYVLRNGITPTTNALKLLELVGLGE